MRLYIFVSIDKLLDRTINGIYYISISVSISEQDSWRVCFSLARSPSSLVSVSPIIHSQCGVLVT